MVSGRRAGQTRADGDFAGPYDVALAEEVRPAARGPLLYRLVVRARDGARREICQRYSAFEELHRRLSSEAALPPKRGLRRVLCGSQQEKSRQLEDYVKQVLANDPWADAAALRCFLGLPKTGTSVKSSVMSISESEEENEQ